MVIEDGLLNFLNRIHNERSVAEHRFVQLGSGYGSMRTASVQTSSIDSAAPADIKAI